MGINNKMWVYEFTHTSGATAKVVALDIDAALAELNWSKGCIDSCGGLMINAWVVEHEVTGPSSSSGTKEDKSGNTEE